MKIALVSAPVKTGDIAFNAASILGSMEQCAGKADLVLFGESVLQGFDCLTWKYDADRYMAVSQRDAVIGKICEMACKWQIAASFGYIEKDGEALFSSQIVIDKAGEIVHNFRRVSIGWKDFTRTDGHYREGERFEGFFLEGKKFAIGLCGDLWTEGKPEEMCALKADAVLWPVWCDYTAEEWNGGAKYEYARQAHLCGKCVLYVNPFCVDKDTDTGAKGGAACFSGGRIEMETPAGNEDTLFVEV